MNFEERKNAFIETMTDADLDYTFKEGFLYLYYWVRAEIYHARMKRMRKKRDRWIDKLDEQHQIFILRVEMKDYGL